MATLATEAPALLGYLVVLAVIVGLSKLGRRA